MKAAILLKLKSTIHKSGIIFILHLAFIVLFPLDCHAQFPFIQREIWDGPYDIKMIAAPNLEAVYINATEAGNSRLRADSIIKYTTMMMSGTNLDINNRYKGGSPFVQEGDITLQSIVCPDINSPCTAGLTLNAPNSTCGTERYNNPPTIPSVYVSMTYADYDTDVNTYSSSMAELDISACSEIEAAYLYWTGMFRGSNPAITLLDGPLNSYSGAGNVFNTSTSSGHNQVKFKIPGGTYQTVTATAANTRNSSSRYLCVADVTAMVQGTGGGQFWVGDVQSYPNEGDGGSSSGWVLVVVFRSPLSPPRLISLWDGLESISSGDFRNFVLTGLQAPSTGNFKSYVGFGALDGENISAEGVTSAEAEGLGFQTNAGGTLYEINPNETDQPPYRMWDDGLPVTCDGDKNLDASGCKVPQFDGNWCSTYDGVSSQKITSYDEATGTNGNEIVRLPSNPITLGLDVHHMKLPAGSVAPGATQATLTVEAGPQGGTTPFLAYIAIERLQPKLDMTKTADKNSTELNTQISYSLRIRNLGNDASLGGDIIYDTLDEATDYVPGSLTSISYQNGVASAPAGASLLTSTGNNLQIEVSQSIPIGDSIDISFTVQVKDYASNISLWDVQCKRSILNTAYIAYNTLSSGVLTSKSNSNDCGIGSETRVLVFDTQLDASSVTQLGPFDACSYIDETVLPHMHTQLINAGISSADIDEFDIRDANYVRMRPEDVFFSDPNSIMSYFAIRDHNSSGNCQEIYEVKFSSCVLPIDLISFTGWKEDNLNILKWVTAFEKNNNYFIIERSINGVDFSPIGVTQGSRNSSTTQTYRFEDEQPFNRTNYYRLKQVDYDGTFSYSKIIAINNEQANLTIYPNPNNGIFTISFKAPEQSYKLDIADVNGKIVYSISGDIVPGSIEVNDLAKGLYIVRLHLNNNTVIKKMVVY